MPKTCDAVRSKHCEDMQGREYYETCDQFNKNMDERLRVLEPHLLGVSGQPVFLGGVARIIHPRDRERTFLNDLTNVTLTGFVWDLSLGNFSLATSANFSC